MKKLVLLFSFVLLSATAFAIDGKRLSPHTVKKDNPARRLAPSTRAEDVFTIQFCDYISSWMCLTQQNKVDYRCYIYIGPEMATQIAGNLVTEITFSAASDFGTKPREGEVFVAEDINSYATSTACTIEDCYSKYEAGGDPWQTVALENPYTVKAGTGFYIGYTVKACRYSQLTEQGDYPVGFDGMPANAFAGYVDMIDGNTRKLLDHVDMANDVGTNLFLAAKTVGKASGFENIFVLGTPMFKNSEFTASVFAPGKATELVVPIRNYGNNAVTSIEYAINVNGVQGDVTTLDINVAPGAYGVITLADPQYVVGKNVVGIDIRKVNGKDYAVSSNNVCFVLGQTDGFDRKFVVEEGTGTWCGFCPRGIVGLEQMTRKYPDSFIGIAVHSGDAMECESYEPLFAYFAGLPSCIINRDPFYIGDPNSDDLESNYEKWLSQRAIAKIDLAVAPVAEGFHVSANTTFAFAEQNANYRLAFVILEDGIEDVQTNYFSGGNELEWWGDQGSKVRWTYEHTARDIFNCAGISGSVPTTLSAGQAYNYNATISSRNVKDKAKTSIVAMLIDGKSGTILNATKVAAKDYKADPADGISSVAAGIEAPVYYNLQGIRVENPAEGSVVIRSQGGERRKMLWRNEK